MNNEVYQEVYGHILNDAQRIRKEIMSEWGDILMFGGTMPKEVVDDLSNAARITGLAFDALETHGIAFSQVDNKPELYRLNVRGESYVCHKSAIPSMSGFLDVVNVPGVSVESQNVNAPVAAKKPPVREEIPSYKEEPVSYASEVEQPQQLESFNEEEEDTDFTYQGREEFESSSDLEDEDQIEDAEEEDDSDEISEETEPETDEVEDEDTEPEYPKRSAEIIGGEPAKITSLIKSDIFMEESTKKVDDIIYEMFDVNLSHSGYSGGGRPEEMTIMIAPLKIQKFATPSVPILVSIYHKGKIITKSSYDQMEDGKNMVTIDVNEFYLLFRGSFDSNGEFRGYVTTTGISAGQGDILNVVSNTKYGDTSSRTVNNGHIKIRSMVDDMQGTIEAFPFGDPTSEEYIIMTKNDEFVDYMYLSNSAKGIKKALIYVDGVKEQAICSWDKDYEEMSLELKEV